MIQMTLPRHARTVVAAGVIAATLWGLPLTAHAQLDKATTEALETYFEFIDYNSGTITSEQIPAEDWKKFHVLDGKIVSHHTYQAHRREETGRVRRIGGRAPQRFFHKTERRFDAVQRHRPHNQ